MSDAINSQPKKRGRPPGTAKAQPEAIAGALRRLADHVEGICKAKGYTATTLQELTELARSTLYNLRKSDPQLSTIYAVANALRVPPYLLLMEPGDLQQLLHAVLDAPEELGVPVPADVPPERLILDTLLPAGDEPDAVGLGALVGQRLSTLRGPKAPPPVTSMEGVATIGEWMRAASSVVVVTGAGMSTEANYLDFRSDKGLRTMFLDYKELSKRTALEKRFDEFVSYYRYRIERLADAESHSGHYILKKWVESRRIARLITLNTDGLHTVDDVNPALELQGNLNVLHCDSCKKGFPSARYLEPSGEWCGCGGKIRPSVRLLDEAPWGAIARNQQLAAEAVRNASLIIILGSSLTDNSATHEILKARWTGAKLVIVNRTDTPLDPVAHAVIQGSAQAFLTRLDRALG